MDISFVILNYRSSRLIKNCLNSLIKCDIKLSYEIIVADNNSNDPYWQKLKLTFPQATFLVNQKNGGYGYGNNRAMKIAKGKYVVILNPDIYVLPGAIEAMHAFMESHPQCAIAAPKLLNADGSTQQTYGRYPDWRLPFYRRSFLGNTAKGKAWVNNYFYENKVFTEPTKVDWVFGACLFMRKDDVLKVGGFDERFFMYIEDTDLCRQINSIGKEVYYLPQTSLIHLHKRDSAELQGLKGLIRPLGRHHLLSWLKYCWKYKNQL